LLLSVTKFEIGLLSHFCNLYVCLKYIDAKKPVTLKKGKVFPLQARCGPECG